MYLKPTLKRFSSIQSFYDFQENTKQEKYLQNDIERISFDELFDFKRLLILGEPGLGKTRLLKEFKQKHPSSFYCDLKQCEGKVIEYLETHISTFELQNIKRIILLDALDEVQEGLVSKTIKGIKNLIREFPNSKIYLSSRTHHVIRNIDLLKDIDFTVAELSFLGFNEIIEYLKFGCIELKDTDGLELINQLKDVGLYNIYSFNGLLATPRYLEIFVKLANEYGFKNVLKLPRSKLLDKFIYQKLYVENEKGKGINFRTKIRYIARILEELAFTLEVQRTNKITKDDFLSFLIDSGFALDSQLPLEDFWDNTILKDIGEVLEFENTEFQEYLAAKSITRLGRVDQVIFDLAIEQQLKDIYPTWKDVIPFLIELEPTIPLPIIQFAIRNKRLHLFYLIRYANHEYINQNIVVKEQIFNLVFDFHIQQSELFRHNVDIALAPYFIASKHKVKLLNTINSKEPHRYFSSNFNVLLLLKEVFQKKSAFTYEELANWKKILFDFAFLPLKDNSESLQRFAIQALGEIVDNIGELSCLVFIYGKRTNFISDSIIDAHQLVSPNHPKSIRLYFKDLQRRRMSAGNHFSKITSSEGFIHFFQIIINNYHFSKSKYHNNYLANLTGRHRDRLENKFYENLRKAWNKSIEEIVIELIVNTEHYLHEREGLFQSVLDILKEKNKQALFIVLERMEEAGKLQDSHFAMCVLSSLLHINQVKALEIVIREKLPDNQFLFRTILQFSTEPQIVKLYQQYFPDHYKEVTDNRTLRDNRQKLRKEGKDTNTQVIFTDFVHQLNQGDFHSIWLFYKNKDTFAQLLSTFRVKKLEKLTIRLLENHSPIDNETTQEKYITSALFYAAINIIDFLEIDIQPYRLKIIKLILTQWELPYENGLVKAFELINPISKEEGSFIVQYLSENEELNIFLLDRIIRFFKKFEDVQAPKLYKRLIEHGKISHYRKIQLLEQLSKWTYEEDYFTNLFHKYQNAEDTDDNFDILRVINKIQLAHHNLEAIDWLIEQYKKYPYKEVRDLNSTSALSGVPKRRGNDLDSNLSVVSHLDFRSKMLDLLSFSIELLDSDFNYERFVSWNIWHPIDDYFNGLRQYADILIENINMLKATISRFPNSDSAISFSYKIEKLHTTYLKELSQPIKLYESIKAIKIIKQKKYLDIWSSKDLFKLVLDVIHKEFISWVEKEGGNKLFISIPSKQREDFIQKFFVRFLRRALLERGFRPSDIIYPIDFSFFREIQNDKNERIDILINYGSIGGTLIEIKREYNNDVISKNYRHKLKQYIKTMNAHYGIFLIFRDDEEDIRERHLELKNLVSEVSNIYKEDFNIEVVGIDCLYKKGSNTLPF